MNITVPLGDDGVVVCGRQLDLCSSEVIEVISKGVWCV